MDALPHHYSVKVTAGESYPAQITSHGLDPLLSAPPSEFGGPGNLWSPETLAVAAVADCFVLTFRAIARASKLNFTTLVCDAEGALDTVDGKTRFTGIHLNVRLTVLATDDVSKAQKLLEKAESGCLIANSLTFAPTLTYDVAVKQPAFARIA